MPGFVRALQFGFKRLFPASGVVLPYPSEVGDLVNLVKNYTQVDFAHDIHLRRSVLVTVGAGANVNHSHPSPIPGCAQLPIELTLWHDNAAAALGTATVVVSTPPFEEWGVFEDASRELSEQSMPAAPAVLGFSWMRAPTLIPMLPGNSVRVDFFAVPVGVTVRSHYYWIDVPVELVDWLHFTRQAAF